MSVTVSKPQYGAHRSGRVNGSSPVTGFQANDLRVWLSSVSLPLTAVLESYCCPAALWSEDRRQAVFDAAAAAQLGLAEGGFSIGKDLWIDCVDPRDRVRFRAALQTLQSGAAQVVCRYRFIPRVTTAAIELQETALRLAPDRSDRWPVLNRYRLRKPLHRRDHAPSRTLIHQVANNLQSIRGEMDLLRLSGVLPQQCFDGIVQAIESIRQLTVEFEDTDTWSPESDGAARGGVEEVRRGRN